MSRNNSQAPLENESNNTHSTNLNSHLAIPLAPDNHVNYNRNQNPESPIHSDHQSAEKSEPAIVIPIKDHSVCDLSMIEKITKLMQYGVGERNF